MNPVKFKFLIKMTIYFQLKKYLQCTFVTCRDYACNSIYKTYRFNIVSSHQNGRQILDIKCNSSVSGISEELKNRHACKSYL